MTRRRKIRVMMIYFEDAIAEVKAGFITLPFGVIVF